MNSYVFCTKKQAPRSGIFEISTSNNQNWIQKASITIAQPHLSNLPEINITKPKTSQLKQDVKFKSGVMKEDHDLSNTRSLEFEENLDKKNIRKLRSKERKRISKDGNPKSQIKRGRERERERELQFRRDLREECCWRDGRLPLLTAYATRCRKTSLFLSQSVFIGFGVAGGAHCALVDPLDLIGQVLGLYMDRWILFSSTILWTN